MLAAVCIDPQHIVLRLKDVKLGSLLALDCIQTAAAALAPDPEAAPAHEQADEDRHSYGHDHLVVKKYAKEKSVQATASCRGVWAHWDAEEDRSQRQYVA